MFSWIKKLFGAADANKDGKIDSKDVKQVVETVAAAAKTTAVKAKTTTKARVNKSKKSPK